MSTIMAESVGVSRRSSASDQPAPSNGLKAGALIAHFRLLKKLGEGGMGAVFLAEDVQLRRQVALKVIKPDFTTHAEARARFLNEARAAACIEHDNIVPIHEVGEDKGVLFLAMQLLRGESLRSRLHKEPRPSLPFVLQVGRHVARGLAAAHAGGFVHRDIKPDNIWIEAPSIDEPKLERAKVLDFGLVRLLESDQNLTAANSMLGTLGYMSPEQACGETVDHRADLFSLGCVLYQMATGKLPFDVSSTFSYLTALAITNPPNPCAIDPGVPPALAMLILRMLDKVADNRPGSAREVAQTLHEIQNESSRRSRDQSRPSELAKPNGKVLRTVGEQGREEVLRTVGEQGREKVPRTVGEQGREEAPRTVGEQGREKAPRIVGEQDREKAPRTVGEQDCEKEKPRVYEVGVGMLSETPFKRRSSWTSVWIAAAAVAVLALAVVLLWPAERGTGTVAFDVSDDAAAILRRGGAVRVEDANGNFSDLKCHGRTQWEEVLKAGTYKIKIVDAKRVKVDPPEISIEKNGKTKVRICVSAVL